MREPLHPQAPPTLPVQPVKPKPIRSVKIGLWILIIVIAVLTAANTFSNKNVQPKYGGKTGQPQATSPEQIQGFSEAESQEALRMKREAEMARNLLAQAQSPQADGVPPMTPQQQQAMAYPQQPAPAAVNPADEQRQQREKKRLDALQSNTLAIDFSDYGKEKGQEKTVAVEGKPHTPAESAGEEPADVEPKNASQLKAEDLNSATGPLFRIFEGTILETVLTNRINGAAAGPINVMVTTDVYSHNRQALLMPQGTRLLGDVRAVQGTNDQRLFVAFHRAIMPDGYSVSLDQFKGLSQIGEVGLRDKVNHHYMQIFGASLALGAIGGIAQVGNGYSSFGYDPMSSIRNGFSQGMGNAAEQVLNHFLQQLPTFLVRERTRVKVYLSDDLSIPAYAAHTMPAAL